MDDEESIRRNLQVYLEDEGFEVVVAANGEEGLQALISSIMPDAVIVDLRLPGMDGNRFIQEAHALRPGTQFLIHTGSVGYLPPPELKAIGLGERHVFKKPLRDLSLIVATIEQLLEMRRGK